MHRRAVILLLLATLPLSIRAQARRPEALWYMRNDEAHIQAFLAHADQISIVSPQVFSLDSNGVIRGRIDPRIIATAKEKNVKLVPLFLNPGFDQAQFHKLLTRPAARRNAIRNLTALCRNNGYAGLQYDVENVHVRDKDLFTAFVRESVDSLHRVGCSVSAAVVPRMNENRGTNSYHTWIYDNWRAVYDYKALADTLDFISLMTYAQHTGNSTPGPVAGFPWVEECLRYTLSLGVPPSKISLGLASYSDWWYPTYDEKKNEARPRGTDIGHTRAMQIIATAKATPVWDDTQKAWYAMWETAGVFEHMWIEDARTFMAKASLVQTYNLRGYSVWVLGLEDPKTWDLVGAVAK
jgi:spore germination protein YaaH